MQAMLELTIWAGSRIVGIAAAIVLAHVVIKFFGL
jgi:hypothetical protein